jgi:hypothetical protein
VLANSSRERLSSGTAICCANRLHSSACVLYSAAMRTSPRRSRIGDPRTKKRNFGPTSKAYAPHKCAQAAILWRWNRKQRAVPMRYLKWNGSLASRSPSYSASDMRSASGNICAAGATTTVIEPGAVVAICSAGGNRRGCRTGDAKTGPTVQSLHPRIVAP